MKIIVLSVLIASLIACGPQKQTKTVSEPPKAKSYKIEQTQKYYFDSNRKEELYQKSLEKIRNTFEREYFQYQLCLSRIKNSKCERMRKDFCEIDVYIDTRSGLHKKPFCKNLKDGIIP